MLRGRWLYPGIWLVGCWALVWGCSKEKARPDRANTDMAPTGDGTDYGPVTAQACSVEGSVRECGRVYHTDGDYVYCSLGHSTCSGGLWGPCSGDRFVIKSLPSLRLTSAGLRLQSLSSTCTNACDPYCLQIEQEPATVSAPGIVPAADAGGVTLEWKEIELTDHSNCTGLQCALVVCGSNGTTTISGRVFDPAGRNPLYNAEVYIPLHPNDALPVFGSGASCDTCGGAQALDAIRATQTDANGNFVLSDVPAGENIPVVVQMGKWRREIVLKSVQSCTDNQVTNNCTAASPSDCVFRLPRNQNDGYDPALGTYSKADLPQTAIITGSADPFDCLLLKAGIDANEVGDSSSNKRIHFYRSDSSAGNTLGAAYGSKVLGSELWNDLNGAAPNMMSYDVILLPCEGGAYDKQKTTGTNTPYKNLLDYANAGGRAFATHYTYSWLAFTPFYAPAPDNWASVANWAQAKVNLNAAKFIYQGSSVNTQDPLTGLVDTSFPKGAVLSQWLRNAHASNRSRRLRIHEGRQDLASVGPNTQSWMTAKDLGYVGSPTYPNLFTFNTPYGIDASKQCGRVVYSDFHVSAAARTACPGGVCPSACLSDADCGFTATCEGETPGGLGQCNEPCASFEDCPNDGYACNGVTPGSCQQISCTKDADCGTGRTCQPWGCACMEDADCNGGTCGSKKCDPGTVCHADANCGNGLCGRGEGSKTGTCKGGFACHTDAVCGLGGTCGSGSGSTKGACARTGGYACHKGSDCDSGSCGAGSGSTAGTCSYGSTRVCHANADCDSGSCGAGTGSALGTCSYGTTRACHANADCDSGSCGAGTGSTAGTCSYGTTRVCHANADCDSGSCGAGTGSALGTCSYGTTRVCHANADCDSGSCGSGTGSALGTCSTSSGICHANADCDSGSCGSGTGSALGTCSTSSGICHANADCDSGACGSGTGSATGSCGILAGASCHRNADCDSNTCGSGTGAVKGVCAILAGATCHRASDCDSGVCGSGTGGSTVGQCATGGRSCHRNADCDSNTCGTGTGAVRGSCNGLGACTTSAQCGGSATCVAGRCTSATPCSADSQCGTGGICNGATCGGKACAADSACTVAGSACNGATCSAPAACAADTACLASGSCTGATCGAPAACASDAACPASRSCTGAKCSTLSCAADAACTKSNLCNNAKCSTLSCALDTACGKSNLCNNAKCSAAPTCALDTACSASRLCNNAKCSAAPACAIDTACPASSLCNNAKCSTAPSCALDTACSVSHLCNNAKCSTLACAGDTACPLSGVCNGAKCSTATCAGDATCPVSGLCNGAKCSAATCSLDTDCPLLLCTGATCNASDCTSNADCASGALCGGSCSSVACSTNADCASGLCNAGVCACTSREDCGGSQQCAGGVLGSCDRSCASDAECAPDRCVGGKCGGCIGDSECHDASYTASCQGIPPENHGTCSTASGTEFPVSCKQGDLLPQEKALEFMFFDLTACVSPDNLPPPKPITNASYNPATFAQDFTAVCPAGTQTVWRDFDWQAEVPEGTSIEFSAQSGDDAATLLPALPAVPVALAKATATTDVGPSKTNYDAALLDTGLGGTGAFNTADPVVLSRNLLRILITLNPSSDKLKAPRLAHWKVQYDCQQAD